MKLPIGFAVKFKKAKFPSKKKLIGKYCFLEPTNVQKHSKDLFKNYFILIFSGSIPFGLYLIINNRPIPIIKNLK